ncbi:MAG: transposase [Acidobacteria bacterium]|nr:transposase [Acidobacteriota bacterium]
MSCGPWPAVIRSSATTLVPVKALSRIFRAKFRDQLKKTDLFAQIDQLAWKKQWVVHSQPVGSGESAFKYLAPYIFRVAISNNRLRHLHDGQITFSYKDSATDQLKRCTLTAQEFIRRFLQHVLPHRFIKVRYYGLLSPAHRHRLLKARHLLDTLNSPTQTPSPIFPAEQLAIRNRQSPILSCPHCGGPLTLLAPIARGRPP